MAPSLYDYQLLVIDQTVTALTPLVHVKTNSLYSCTTINTLTSSPVSLGSLLTVISADAVSNPTIMKVNTLVTTTQTIVQLVYRMSARITDKPKLNDVQPRFHVIDVNVRSMGRPAVNNTQPNLTREKSQTPCMSVCAPTSVNVPRVRN